MWIDTKRLKKQLLQQKDVNKVIVDYFLVKCQRETSKNEGSSCTCTLDY